MLRHDGAGGSKEPRLLAWGDGISGFRQRWPGLDLDEQQNIPVRQNISISPAGLRKRRASTV